MAMWSNPKTRKIKGILFHLESEGVTRKAANAIAQEFRNRRQKARVIEDERLGRYDVKNRSPYYCVYVERKRGKK